MNDRFEIGVDDGEEELPCALRQAVNQICAEPPPGDAVKETLNRAATQLAAEQGSGLALLRETRTDTSLEGPAGQSPRLALSIAASIAIITVSAAMIGYLIIRPHDDAPLARRDNTIDHRRTKTTVTEGLGNDPGTMNNVGEQQNEIDGATAQTTGADSESFGVSNNRDNLGVPASDGIEPAADFGGVSTRGGTQAPRGFGGQARAGTGRFAGASPSRWLAVAGEATVLVSTGAVEPIDLGARQPWNDKTTLHIWDWAKSTKSKPLDAVADRSMTLSPDGKKVVTNDGRAIDTTTGEVTRLANFDGDVYRAKFSRDGRMLVLMIYGGGNQGTARVLEFPSGKKICEIPDIFPHMFVADFSSGGKQVVLIGMDLRTRRFETTSGRELTKYEPAHSNSVRAVTISNGGNYVVSSGPNNETYLWEADSGKLLHKLAVTQRPDVIHEVYSLAFSPDDKLLAGGGVQNLLLWNTQTGDAEKIYPTSSGGAVHVRFDMEGKEMTTVNGFHGTRGENGQDLLVYPRVQQWPVEKE
jgi:WD40 domain-containing protein